MENRSASGPTIVITNGWGLGTPSGVARHLQELSRALADAGAKVVVVCVSTAGYSGFPRPRLPEELEGRAIEGELAGHGVEVVRVRPHRLHWMLDGRPLRKAVKRLLLDRPVDAVLSYFNEGGWLRQLTLQHGATFGYICTLQSYAMALDPARQGAGLRGKLMRLANRKVILEPYRSADVLFANSEFTRGELVEVLGADPERIAITYLGVQPHFFEIERPPPSAIRRFIFFGRLVPEKGIAEAIAALGVLAARGERDWTFRVLGSGNREHVLGLARQHGIADQVELVPHQGDDGLRRELEAADLAILPSWSESFGLSIAEAQAAGLPVIAYEAGSVPEVVAAGETAWLVPLRDVAGLTDCLAEAVADPDATHAKGLRGRERIRELFSWSETAKRVLARLATERDRR